MAQPQRINASPQAHADPVWARVRSEAEVVVRQEPELSSFIYSSVLHHDRLEQVVVHRIAERLDRWEPPRIRINFAYHPCRGARASSTV